jgi:hypothetical protein
MSFDAAVAILSLALSVLRDQSAGKVKSDAAVAESLSEIVRIAAREYEDRVGQPLDPSLIKAENPI